MVVIVKEKYKTTVKVFKRKGLRYYLFILSLKIYNIEYDTIKE